MKKIVTIGGGTGTFMVLNALKDYPMHLSAIVSMADDGGSTGILRDEYGVLPPGDIRRALVALSRSGDTMRNLFNYRFDGGGFHGHSFGNLFLSALERTTGNFADAVREASQILNIAGEVIPVTLDNVRLHARLEDGSVIRGERNIDIPKTKSRSRISKVWLKPRGRINPAARRALLVADMIIIGPGDLYTSIIPNLLVRGMPQAIRKSKAKKIYIANLMTKFGETHGFGANDFVEAVEKYLGEKILDLVIFNSKKPPAAVLRRYKKEKAEFIEPPAPKSRSRGKPEFILRDLLDKGKFVRHERRGKLAKVILSLLR